MYANHREPKERTVLQAICELVAKSDEHGGVDSIVTFNFDDLLVEHRRADGRLARI